MFKVFKIITMFLVFLLLSSNIGFSSAEKMNVAVLEFEVKGDLGEKDAGAIIAEWMINALHMSNEYDLRERVLLKKILEEQQLGMTGLIDKKTATKIGEIYGVKGIITGSVIKWGEIIYINARLIDTENGAILKANEVKAVDINDIRNKIDDLALIIAGKQTEKKDVANSSNEIDISVDVALERFYRKVIGAKDFTKLAKGLLILPNTVKAGFIVGGEYGKGALRVGGMTVDYYKLTSGSFGLQIGAQKKDIIIAFMTKEALKQFQGNSAWEAGVDGNIALMDTGASKDISTYTFKQPIVAFIFDVKGLMADISLKGSKLTRLNKSKWQ
ncbi:MAG: YSC84-related protein [Nitrospirota bacterium]